MAVSDHYDISETREPAAREKDLFARLPDVLRKAMAAARSGALHLLGMDHETDDGEMLARQAEILAS